MADIELVDVSIRDGNQSLWGATGLTGQILQIAPVLDRVGFQALDFTSSTHMGIAVRTHKENPWERIRLMRAAMPNTPLQFITHRVPLHFLGDRRARISCDSSIGAWSPTASARFAVLDPMHDMAALLESAHIIHSEGGEESSRPHLYESARFTTTPSTPTAPGRSRVAVRRPALYQGPGRTSDAGARADPDSRGARRIGGKPLEVHSHCTSAWRHHLSCRRGLGVEAACRLRAARERHVASLRSDGRQSARARAHRRHRRPRLTLASRLLQQLAAAEGLPSRCAPGIRRGVPASPGARRSDDHDATPARGAQAGRPVPSGHWRRSTGCAPSSAIRSWSRPFRRSFARRRCSMSSAPERYGNVPDQVIRYVLGTFGRPTAPVDPNILDRILERPRARSDGRAAAARLAELRAASAASATRNFCCGRSCPPPRSTPCSRPARPAATTTPTRRRAQAAARAGIPPPAARFAVEQAGLSPGAARTGSPPRQVRVPGTARWCSTGCAPPAVSFSTWTARWC